MVAVTADRSAGVACSADHVSANLLEVAAIRPVADEEAAHRLFGVEHDVAPACTRRRDVDAFGAQRELERAGVRVSRDDHGDLTSADSRGEIVAGVADEDQ